MQIIDGKTTAAEIREELKNKIKNLPKPPGLVTILVGDDPASKVYVNSKQKACAETGMYSVLEKLDENVSENELLEIIEKYNNDESIHGILVQLPLPAHIDEDKVIEAISPKKDADGFHPVSMGNLVIGKETFFPCTPHGILVLLERYGIETSGKHVVVVGRSNIVGKPVANMLMQKKKNANAIVTVCHSAAADLSYYTKQADILIAAIGRADFITSDMVKDGVVVIDVGINRVEDASKKRGYRLTGDVDFEGVSEKASYITPVPGGVGPMTIAMLLENTYTAFQRIENFEE